jgi:hypothetical protein
MTSSRRTSRRPRGLLVALGALAALLGSPSAALAASGIVGIPTYQTPVTVGDTNQPGSIEITNLSTAPNDVDPMTLDAVHVTLSCGVHFNEGSGPPPGTAPNCPQPQPGVFALSATGTGRAGSACAGTTFAIAVINPSTGKVGFTPNAPVLLPPSTFPPPSLADSCVIDFTFNVISAPTIDCEPASSGNQTCHTTDVEGTVDGLFASGSQSPRCGITVFPPVPPVCGASSGPPPTTPPGTTPPTTPPQAPPSAEVLCSRRLISLVRADVKHGRVVLKGLVAPRLAGRPIAIFANYRRGRRSALKRLATVTSNAAGQFTARLRPPPRKFFEKVRYEARIGRARSPRLKLPQSLVSSSIRATGGQIELRGKVKRALLGRRNPVVIKRLICGRYRTVATVKPDAKGKYVARFAAPTGVEAALYRAESRVLARRGSRRHVKQYARAILIVLTEQSG